jgi:hypothetical protein
VIDLAKLRVAVQQELDDYPVPPPRHPDLVGSALPAEWFERGLAEMREALVEPYVTEAVWFDSVAQQQVSRPVAVVADDQGAHVIALDIEGDEFELFFRSDDALHSMNVRGDAVGCFLAR